MDRGGWRCSDALASAKSSANWYLAFCVSAGFVGIVEIANDVIPGTTGDVAGVADVISGTTDNVTSGDVAGVDGASIGTGEATVIRG